MTVIRNPRIYNKNMPEELDLPIVPIGSMLKGGAKYFSNRTAFIYHDYSMTYQELYEEALKLANGLQHLGYGKGDVISVQLPNSLQFVISYFGILLSGATYSPINPFLPPSEVIYQVENNQTKAIITHESCAKLLTDHSEELHVNHIIVTGAIELQDKHTFIDVEPFNPSWLSFNEFKSRFEAKELQVDIDPLKDIAHISYTGGTTGKPKGVLSTHYNFISNCLLSCASSGFIPFTSEDGALTVKPYTDNQEEFLQEYSTLLGESVMMSPAPLYHISGLMGVVGYGMLQGATAILIDQFNPATYISNIEKYKVTMASGAPQVFNYLLTSPNIHTTDFSSIKNIGSGAAPISAELQRKLRAIFPGALITEGYGLTEATGACIQSVPFKSGLTKTGTIGVPLYNTQVKLVSLDGSNQQVAAGERGELWIKGPQVAVGYLDNPEETSATFVDGWLRTGDIAIMDEDGIMSIVDRKKDMLIYNGYNVYPRQLEELLYEHEAVVTAVVVGIADQSVGERPKAFVVLKEGTTSTLEDIKEYVNTRVVHYAKIREIEQLDELPMTAAGKISKIALQNREVEKLNQQ